MLNKKSILFLTILAYVAFLLGVWWRYQFIFYDHPPGQYLTHDMSTYRNMAIAWLKPHYVQSIADTYRPVGMVMYLMINYKFDPSGHLAILTLFLISCLTPIILAIIARDIYDHRASMLTLVMASLYFPFIKYAGYFLAEAPLLFFLSLGMCFLVKGLKAQNNYVRFFFSLLSGLLFGLAGSFKMLGFTSVFLVGLGILVFTLKHRLRPLLILSLAGFIGLMTITIPMAVWCTKVSQGQFCVCSNDWNNLVMGHYGDTRDFYWRDKRTNNEWKFAYPDFKETWRKGEVHFDFYVYDKKKNIDAAWQWITAHPIHALFLSIQNIFILFALPLWPVEKNNLFLQSEMISQWLFWLFILLPVLLQLSKNFKSLIKFDKKHLSELILILPILGLIITVFCSVSYPRYRIPFDGFFMILAAHYWTKSFGTSSREADSCG